MSFENWTRFLKANVGERYIEEGQPLAKQRRRYYKDNGQGQCKIQGVSAKPEMESDSDQADGN